MPPLEIPADEEKQPLSRSSSSSGSISSIGIYPRQNIPAIQRADSLNTISSSSENEAILEGIPNRRFQGPLNPRYSPIILPREPTLDELLRQATGQNDIENVESVQLRVISSVVSVQGIALFMPHLISLNLSGSALSSLRDLGCAFEFLYHLNVSHCGLRSLDGTNGIPTIQTLIADGNLLEDVGPCMNLTELKELSVRNNKIKSIGLLTFLSMCKKLQELNLVGNPVRNCEGYRDRLIKNVKTLKILDGENLCEQHNEDAHSFNNLSSDNTSSLSSWSSEDQIENFRISSNSRRRPATSGQGSCRISILDPSFHVLRPSTAGENQLSENFNTTAGRDDTIIQGNILSRARNKKQFVKSAWGYSSTSSSASFSSLELSFPRQLPQNTVQLECGVVGMVSTMQPGHMDSNRSDSSENTDSLQKISKKWRLECQRKRDDDALS